jgi:hypothetical protein
VAFVILSFHCAHDPTHGLGGSHVKPWDANMSSDATRREASHASNEETQAHEERERSVHRRVGSEKAGDGGLL